MEDTQLKELLLSDPQKGLSKAIDLYGGSVKWIAIKIIGTERPRDVEECVSDAFVKLWRNIGRGGYAPRKCCSPRLRGLWGRLLGTAL